MKVFLPRSCLADRFIEPISKPRLKGSASKCCSDWLYLMISDDNKLLSITNSTHACSSVSLLTHQKDAPVLQTETRKMIWNFLQRPECWVYDQHHQNNEANHPSLYNEGW